MGFVCGSLQTLFGLSWVPPLALSGMLSGSLAAFSGPAGQCPKTARLQVLFAFLGILLVTFAAVLEFFCSLFVAQEPKMESKQPPSKL